MPSILDSNKTIFFKEDIVKEMSDELNIPEKELKELVDLNIKYIKESIEKKPILLISLPSLAKLRFNLKLGMSSKYECKFLTSVSGKRKYKSLTEKITLLSSFNSPGLKSFNKPLAERLYKKIKRYKKVFRVYASLYYLWSVVEKKNNEILEKIK